MAAETTGKGNDIISYKAQSRITCLWDVAPISVLDFASIVTPTSWGVCIFSNAPCCNSLPSFGYFDGFQQSTLSKKYCLVEWIHRSVTMLSTRIQKPDVKCQTEIAGKLIRLEVMRCCIFSLIQSCGWFGVKCNALIWLQSQKDKS